MKTSVSAPKVCSLTATADAPNAKFAKNTAFSNDSSMIGFSKHRLDIAKGQNWANESGKGGSQCCSS